jgi:hypothetical protein
VDHFEGPAHPKAAFSSKDIAPSILSSDGGWILLFTVRSTVPAQFIPKVSSERLLIRLAQRSCNHFYSSKLADASQFTSLGAGL